MKSARKMAGVLIISILMTCLMHMTVFAYFSSTKMYKDFTFTDLNGQTYTMDSLPAGPIVVIYGRSGCSNTKATIAQARSCQNSGLCSKVFVLGVDSYDSGLSSLARQYPAMSFVKASSSNNYAMWSLLNAAGYRSSSMTLPGTFILDQHHNIAYYGTGNQSSSLSSTLRSAAYTSPIPVTSSQISVTLPYTETVATGKAVKPEPEVSYTGTGSKLKKGRDYEVTYKNNRKIGTATVTVKGINGFSDSVNTQFKIYANGVKKGKKFRIDNVSYKVTKGGKSGKVEVACTGASLARLNGSVYLQETVTYKGNICKITSVTAGAFKNKKALRIFYAGPAVTTIGDNAFSGCSELMTASVGMKCKKIGKKAFYKCSSLGRLYLPTRKLKSSVVGAKAFSGVRSDIRVFAFSNAYIEKYKKWLGKKGIPAAAVYSLMAG